MLTRLLRTGPETVDYSMIGTTRRINPTTNTVDWVRFPHHGQKQPPPHAKENIIYRVHPEREGRRHIFQIGTSDPQRAVAAARLVAPDVAGIDVNAGCPKPFSTHDGMGAALLRTPDRLVAILEALVRDIVPEFGIGVSVKIRILETPAETEALVRRLVATGITALTVHCRTTPMRPRERAIRGQLRMVADVCREAGVACLMNGDVENRDAAAKLVEEYGVDGAMIATAAEKNMSCFRTLEQGGMASWSEVADKYIQAALDVENRFGNTKYLLNQIIPGKQPAYKKVQTCKSYAALCEALGLVHLVERAKEVDVAIGIAVNPSKKKTEAATEPARAAAVNGGGKRKTAEDGPVQAEEASTKRQRVTDEAVDENTAPEKSQPAVSISA